MSVRTADCTGLARGPASSWPPAGLAVLVLVQPASTPEAAGDGVMVKLHLETFHLQKSYEPESITKNLYLDVLVT